MQHEMFLMSADMREVYARLSAKRKADVADHSAPLVRENTRANTSPSAPDSGQEGCNMNPSG
jgi:hypothetical protein